MIRNISKFTMLLFSIGVGAQSTMVEAKETKLAVRQITQFVKSMPKGTQAIVGGGQWKKILGGGAIHGSSNAPRIENLTTVQRLASRFEYRTDRDNYNVEDYWASPRETEAHFSGDCEDIAIWKYSMLRRMGWLPDQLNLWIVLFDDKGQTLQHMILMAKFEDQEYLLNSPGAWSESRQTEVEAVTAKDMNKKFTFIYRFNEDGASIN